MDKCAEQQCCHVRVPDSILCQEHLLADVAKRDPDVAALLTLALAEAKKANDALYVLKNAHPARRWM